MLLKLLLILALGIASFVSSEQTLLSSAVNAFVKLNPSSHFVFIIESEDLDETAHSLVKNPVNGNPSKLHVSWKNGISIKLKRDAFKQFHRDKCMVNK